MDEYLKKLIEENLELTKEIHKMTKKINNYMLWSQIFGFLKVLIIVVPTVLAIIYLPPLLKDVFSQYQSLLGGGSSGSLIQSFLGGGAVDSGNIDPNKLPPELQKYLK